MWAHRSSNNVAWARWQASDLWRDAWSGVKHLTEIVELFYSSTADCV
jgi:hypothetical protein